jgi:hypothetical protein
LGGWHAVSCYRQSELSGTPNKHLLTDVATALVRMSNCFAMDVMLTWHNMKHSMRLHSWLSRRPALCAIPMCMHQTGENFIIGALHNLTVQQMLLRLWNGREWDGLSR